MKFAYNLLLLVVFFWLFNSGLIVLGVENTWIIFLSNLGAGAILGYGTGKAGYEA